MTLRDMLAQTSRLFHHRNRSREYLAGKANGPSEGNGIGDKMERERKGNEMSENKNSIGTSSL